MIYVNLVQRVLTHSSNVVLMLGHRLRCRSNIKTTSRAPQAPMCKLCVRIRIGPTICQSQSVIIKTHCGTVHSIWSSLSVLVECCATVWDGGATFNHSFTDTDEIRARGYPALALNQTPHTHTHTHTHVWITREQPSNPDDASKVRTLRITDGLHNWFYHSMRWFQSEGRCTEWVLFEVVNEAVVYAPWCTLRARRPYIISTSLMLSGSPSYPELGQNSNTTVDMYVYKSL